MKPHTRRKQRRARKRLVIPDCKHFTGYKPCFPGTRCYQGCARPDPVGTRILIVNLDAMGNVLATTSLLPPLKRKYPKSRVLWITLANSAPLLQLNPYLDGVYVWSPESWLILQQMQFDLVLNVDKSLRSCAFVMAVKARKKRGFGLNKNGAIIPLNRGAEENYVLGLDDFLKFRVNQKPTTQLLTEAMELKYRRDDYVLTLSADEKAYASAYRKELGIHDDEFVVGFNTGCSELYPNKKMSIEQHVQLIRRLSRAPGLRLLLLGGPEDAQRNAEIARQVGEHVSNTPTGEGLRRGLVYIDLCDLVITGDSFGMHATIGLKKLVIVWFGVSCPAEIDLYERGVKLIPEGLECSPCWKRECPYHLECIQMIDLDAIVRHVEQYHAAWRSASQGTRIYA